MFIKRVLEKFGLIEMTCDMYNTYYQRNVPTYKEFGELRRQVEDLGNTMSMEHVLPDCRFPSPIWRKKITPKVDVEFEVVEVSPSMVVVRKKGQSQLIVGKRTWI